MQWKGYLLFPVGLGVGLVLASVGATLFWLQELSPPSRALTTTTVNPSTVPAELVTYADLAAFKAELARFTDRGSVEEQLSNEMQRELASFRAHLTQVDHEQKAIAQAITKLTTQLAKVRRERRAGPVREDTAETRPSTPEEEVKRADAQVNAQVDLIEDMMRAEAPDPTWTDAAELSLQGMFHREEPTGFYLVHAECRTTVCRLELSLDGSVSPAESFRNLVHLMPWQGQGFVRIEDGESAAVVVYLAREGYAFPRAAE